MIVVALGLELMLANPPEGAGLGSAQATAAFMAHKPCPVPANLPADSSIRFQPDKGVVPADLDGAQYQLPKTIPFFLGQTVPPPAPDFSQLDLGQAAINTETGAVTINGIPVAAPTDCR